MLEIPTIAEGSKNSIKNSQSSLIFTSIKAIYRVYACRRAETNACEWNSGRIRARFIEKSVYRIQDLLSLFPKQANETKNENKNRIDVQCDKIVACCCCCCCFWERMHKRKPFISH